MMVMRFVFVPGMLGSIMIMAAAGFAVLMILLMPMVMSMVVYGLLPRVVLWAFSSWRLKNAVNGTILHLPGVADLLERMNREFVETRAREAETLETPPPGEAAAAAAHRLGGRSCALISWSDVPRDDGSLSRGAAGTWGCAATGAWPV